MKEKEEGNEIGKRKKIKKKWSLYWIFSIIYTGIDGALNLFYVKKVSPRSVEKDVIQIPEFHFSNSVQDHTSSLNTKIKEEEQSKDKRENRLITFKDKTFNLI